MKVNSHGLLKPLTTAALVSLATMLSLSGQTLADDKSERLLGANEVPPVISAGEGDFKLKFRDDRIEFRLSYELDSSGSEVTQAHIHIGNPSTEGGITVFLCTNLGNTPPGATFRACPLTSGEVAGDIVASDVREVVGSDGLIIGNGDLEGLKRLLEDGATYINVHSIDHPAGEIRGQVNPRDR